VNLTPLQLRRLLDKQKEKAYHYSGGLAKDHYGGQLPEAYCFIEKAEIWKLRRRPRWWGFSKIKLIAAKTKNSRIINNKKGRMWIVF